MRAPRLAAPGERTRSWGQDHDPEAEVRRLSSLLAEEDPKTGQRQNLDTFASRAAAEKHERAVQYFNRR